ncbi:hypothetical protein F4804DRAFT_116926 [Jackrogersella minutella]|nr:hypothetical protein F4804DRAFT_116926 [Jackrogersella minutella]
MKTIKMPTNLADLETYIGITGSLRKHNPWYQQKLKPLQAIRSNRTHTEGQVLVRLSEECFAQGLDRGVVPLLSCRAFRFVRQLVVTVLEISTVAAAIYATIGVISEIAENMCQGPAEILVNLDHVAQVVLISGAILVGFRCPYLSYTRLHVRCMVRSKNISLKDWAMGLFRLYRASHFDSVDSQMSLVYNACDETLRAMSCPYISGHSRTLRQQVPSNGEKESKAINDMYRELAKVKIPIEDAVMWVYTYKPTSASQI